MPYTTIKKPSDYFDTKLHTGTGASKTLAYDFEVDFYWTKMRNDAYSPTLFDSIRGNNGNLRSSASIAEAISPNTVSFGNASGVTLGSDSSNYGINQALNDSSQPATYVGWGWKASGTSVSNTDGSITSTVSANTTSGFSIVSYTGNTDASKTIGHGLGTAPSMIITKDRDNTRNWCVYHKSLGATQYLLLNGNGAVATSTGRWNDTAPTSSVFTVGDDAETGNAFNYIAYCFAEKQGFSKFGSYTGNGSADGTFVYTGFKPEFVMVKKSSGINSWLMHDTKRSTLNPMDNQLFANSNNAEDTTSTNDNFDFLSNGFKARNTGDAYNGSGGTYIYMAFAEEPLVGDNPATAR